MFWPRYIILHKKSVFPYAFSRKKWLLNFHKTLRKYLYREWLFLGKYFYHVTNLWYNFFKKFMLLDFMTLLTQDLFLKSFEKLSWKTIYFFNMGGAHISLAFLIGQFRYHWVKSVQIRTRKKLCIWTLFTQCISDFSFTLLGIIHEQSRFDRDRYVNVKFSNIRSSKLTTTIIFLPTELVTLDLSD